MQPNRGGGGGAGMGGQYNGPPNGMAGGGMGNNPGGNMGGGGNLTKHQMLQILVNQMKFPVSIFGSHFFSFISSYNLFVPSQQGG